MTRKDNIIEDGDLTITFFNDYSLNVSYIKNNLYAVRFYFKYQRSPSKQFIYYQHSSSGAFKSAKQLQSAIKQIDLYLNSIIHLPIIEEAVQSAKEIALVAKINDLDNRIKIHMEKLNELILERAQYD